MRTPILLLALLLQIAPVFGQDAQPTNAGARTAQSLDLTLPRDRLPPQSIAGGPAPQTAPGGQAPRGQGMRMPYGSGYEARIGGMGSGRGSRGRGR